nr:immunoglobulin light chain junction region [Macaca mulatta]MOV94656.1 immunoglobulin light chain junction region [Macaca mulatta]MOV95972.1 immunoglobulin light chain junction region [Macaca mulatta]MOV96007.1 immunoglobulin light chain junction region [Macaca mulatta]MOV96377.1 immunoglobulin light chain junction region [Macaca mulatta]
DYYCSSYTGTNTLF